MCLGPILSRGALHYPLDRPASPYTASSPCRKPAPVNLTLGHCTSLLHSLTAALRCRRATATLRHELCELSPHGLSSQQSPLLPSFLLEQLREAVAAESSAQGSNASPRAGSILGEVCDAWGLSDRATNCTETSSFSGVDSLPQRRSWRSLGAARTGMSSEGLAIAVEASIESKNRIQVRSRRPSALLLEGISKVNIVL